MICHDVIPFVAQPLSRTDPLAPPTDPLSRPTDPLSSSTTTLKEKLDDEWPESIFHYVGSQSASYLLSVQCEV